MILLALLFSAGPPPTKAPKPVLPAFVLYDEAKLFSREEIDKATERLKAFQKRFEARSLPLVVETVKSQPDFKGPGGPLEGEEREEALRKWARERAEKRKPVNPCLYVLVSKEPPDAVPLAWEGEATVRGRIKPGRLLLPRVSRKLRLRLTDGFDTLLLRAAYEVEWAVEGPIRDGAKMFSEDAIKRATETLQKLEQTYYEEKKPENFIEFIVETVEEQRDVSNLNGWLNGAKRSAALEEWAAGKAEGRDTFDPLDASDQRVYVVISRSPPDVRVVAWPAKTADKIQSHLLGRIRRTLASQMRYNPNGALQQGITEFERILDDLQERKSPLQTLSLLMALGVLAGAWVVLSIVTRALVPSAPTQYTAAAQGNVFGTPASLWVVDQLLPTDAPAPPPAPAVPPSQAPPGSLTAELPPTTVTQTPPAPPEGPSA
jgi:hypothetical protein